MLILKDIAVIILLIGMLNILLAIVAPKNISLHISGHSYSLFSIGFTLMTASLGILLYTTHGN